MARAFWRGGAVRGRREGAEGAERVQEVPPSPQTREPAQLLPSPVPDTSPETLAAGVHNKAGRGRRVCAEGHKEEHKRWNLPQPRLKPPTDFPEPRVDGHAPSTGEKQAEGCAAAARAGGGAGRDTVASILLTPPRPRRTLHSSPHGSAAEHVPDGHEAEVLAPHEALSALRWWCSSRTRASSARAPRNGWSGQPQPSGAMRVMRLALRAALTAGRTAPPAARPALRHTRSAAALAQSEGVSLAAPVLPETCPGCGVKLQVVDADKPGCARRSRPANAGSHTSPRPASSRCPSG